MEVIFVDSSDIKEFVQSLVIAGVLAFLIITFVAQSFVVEGSSMENTLQNGERLIANKLIYHFRTPERGEIVVFTPQGAEDKRYIKRVLGLPGDRIYIRDQKLYINGEPVEEDYIKEPMRDIGSSGPFEVPEDSYFVLGDNRNHSADSRFESLVGYVKEESIHGKASWVFWPLTEMRIIEHKDYAIDNQ